MTKQELGVFTCRVFSLYACMQFILYLSSVGPILQYLTRNSQLQQQDILMAMYQISPAVMMFTLTIALWIFAEKIGFLMTSDLNPSGKISRIDPAIILGFSVMLCGLYILLQTIPRLSSQIFNVFLMHHDKTIPRDLFRNNAVETFILFAKFAIAYVFLRQPYRVIGFLMKQTPNSFQSNDE